MLSSNSRMSNMRTWHPRSGKGRTVQWAWIWKEEVVVRFDSICSAYWRKCHQSFRTSDPCLARNATENGTKIRIPSTTRTSIRRMSYVNIHQSFRRVTCTLDIDLLFQHPCYLSCPIRILLLCVLRCNSDLDAILAHNCGRSATCISGIQAYYPVFWVLTFRFWQPHRNLGMDTPS